MDNSENNMLKIATQASKLAIKYLKKHNSQSLLVNSSNAHDIKLQGDVLSERVIIDFLTKKTDIPIISEEDSANKEFLGNKKGKVWIIDPIDGTLNYSRGIPISCISISLWENNEPILGVINDFNRNEIFSGIVGGSAFCNNIPIRVSKVNKKNDAVIAMGFPSKTNFEENVLLGFVTKVQEYKKVRLIGSAALSIAYVACGRFDVYMEKGIMLWDIAAGIAIARAAGGKSKFANINDNYQYDALVSNKALYPFLEGEI